MQTLEGTPPAKPAPQAHTKTRWVSIRALPASLGATQTQREALGFVGFVGQEPTRQAMVPQPDAQTVMLGNRKIRKGRAHVLIAILAGIARIQGNQHVIKHQRGISPIHHKLVS